ncbi:CDF family Co(II)/Ni(II) efflux transporter DmeF [Vacuolonema iberomarrocanum]|uniref:CDF family Co(II)/Ni(II) efflux transporter DmeF n=1 Tax=Vacuolonema iberomarrocanum TaxID=3454632 RepID=UPI001A0FEC14|nr:CDF family Co(II)/Ni(II) efflux transporter DmeF [filamentous cyanobacterium LEGE 07170]
MHIYTLDQWQHSHDFAIAQTQAEKRTKIVLLLTAITMVVEIAAGTVFGSMALLADGWHMATHVAAFAITVFAYAYARRHAHDPKYTFGTGKVSVLGGFTSAVALGVVAFIMAMESIGRFFDPHTIRFNEAIYVAVIGLAVNLISAWLLGDHHDHAHHHGSHGHGHHDHADHSHGHHGHDHAHHDHESDEHSDHDETDHRDHNLQAAYIHVLADALTSVLAIVALFSGKYLGWVWMDAVMGLVGAAVISRWAYGLVRDTGVILLDGAADNKTRRAIASAIESDMDNRVADLHVWNVSPYHLSAMVVLVTHFPQPPDHYKHLLEGIPALSHVVIEVNSCHGEPCIEVQPPAQDQVPAASL